MRAIERLRHLLETHGIYDQTVRLMRQHALEEKAIEPSKKDSKERMATLRKTTGAKGGVEETASASKKASKDRLRSLSKVTGAKEGVKETEDELDEVAPPGFKGTAKAMKRHKDIDNPFALAWWQKNQGYKSHKTRTGKDKKE